MWEKHINHSKPQEQNEKVLHNQKSLSGDGTIKTVMICPVQCKAEKQTHQTTDKQWDHNSAHTTLQAIHICS